MLKSAAGYLFLKRVLTRRDDHYRNMSYGPFRLICGKGMEKLLDDVYNEECYGNMTVRQRVLEVDRILSVEVDLKLSTVFLLV